MVQRCRVAFGNGIQIKQKPGPMAPANPFNRAKKYHLASHWGMFVPTLFRAYLALVAFFSLTQISFAAFSKGIFARNYSDKAYISNFFPWKKNVPQIMLILYQNDAGMVSLK